ncbi:hypothetical protein IC232_23580 [Microvirga sp. BT688]|uniref:hypothetical protein n=1 Tax=Microvirga sp. TaxID=1873136 RepID=UPI0016829D05|nr:hypothetical protein [Microvirga sp.]MBD2749664.1 hypothetical protein [Microvirga sp.]
MWRSRKIASVIRGAAALASAMSLVIHIALMSIGAGRQMPAAPTAGKMSLHHSHDAGGHGPSEPVKDTRHVPACCILSQITGSSPPPSTGHLSPPLATAIVVTFVGAPGPAAIRILPSYPVGARAPPASA